MNSTKGNNRPYRPYCHLDERVSDRIEALLARVDGIRLARDINKPTRFNREGEQHARRVAEADGGGPRQAGPCQTYPCSVA